jgi:hypothetical protein
MSDEFPPRPPFAPLTSNDARALIFGRFSYVPAPTRDNPEGIRILGDWETKNIIQVPLPQMKSRGLGSGMPFHRLGARQLQGMWAAWEKAGLLNLVLEFDGSFAPRFVRGSRTSLSNHCFGTAFDINYEGNELGRQPAPVGVKGSVRPLVPIANAWGFFWGGHYQNRKDGMHFELTVPDMNGSPLPAVPPAPPATPVLRRGSSGDDVRLLQQSIGVPADGSFGAATEHTVEDFQRQNALTVDGEVGAQMWAELAKPANKPRVGYCPFVMASVFGGASDRETSAYDGHLITDTEICLSLPWRFAGTRPRGRITNRLTHQFVEGSVEDIGPWNGTTAAKSDRYLLEGRRPQAETGRDLTGRRTNLAGVDLSPALARAIGIDGLGRVDVEIVNGPA